MGKKSKTTTRYSAEKLAKQLEKDNKIKELERLIRKYKKAYYAGTPLVSDAEYDAIEAELKSLAPGSKALKIVGTTTTGNIKHDPPMLSSDKTTDVNEVIEWAKQYPIVWGYKVDGLSAKLVYERGKLVLGATRGNGIEGENITNQAMRLYNIPLQLPIPVDCEIRGEIYMTKDAFEKAKTNEGEQWKSPRNLAVGTIKSNDPSLVEKRKLQFMAWDLIIPGKMYAVTEKIKLLKEFHFMPADKALIKATKIEKLFDDMIKIRDDFIFEMDGLIFKINDPAVQLELGSTEHHPRWMLALKYPTGFQFTKIREITWQVSRNGILTPVAELQPILLAGATISRATLHNAGFVMERNITAGDSAKVVRSGDVIPKVIDIRKNENTRASLPKACPICGGITKLEGKFLHCMNSNCVESKIQAILHFIDEVDILGIGENTARLLNIKHPADLYKLEKNALIKLLGKNGEKIHDRIQQVKTLPIDKFLPALGIPGLGHTASRKIAKEASSMEAITPELVNKIFGAGSKTAKSINNGLKNKPWLPYFKAGVRLITGDVKKLEHPITAESNIAGKKIYVTGKVEGMDKIQLQEFVEKFGGKWVTSVSKSMDFLVTGEKAGPAKKAEAQKLITDGYKIKIMPWDEFKQFVTRGTAIKKIASSRLGYK